MTTDDCEPGRGNAGGETPQTPTVKPAALELPQTGPDTANTFTKLIVILAAGITTYGAMFYLVNRRELFKK